jgi:hypothetical protein
VGYRNQSAAVPCLCRLSLRARRLAMESATEFIQLWLSEEVHGVSPLIQNAYVEMLQWLSQNPHTRGFNEKSKKPDLDDASPFGVAKQFFWYFETHFFKAQNSLITMDLGLISPIYVF